MLNDGLTHTNYSGGESSQSYQAIIHPYMEHYGSVWLRAAPHGSARLRMVRNGSTWFPMQPYMVKSNVHVLPKYSTKVPLVVIDLG